MRSLFVGASARARPVLRGANAPPRASSAGVRPAGWRGLLPASAHQMLEAVGEPQRWALTVEGVSIMLSTTLSAAGHAAQDEQAQAPVGNSVDEPAPHERHAGSEASSDSTSHGTSLIPAQNGSAANGQNGVRSSSHMRAVRFNKAADHTRRPPGDPKVWALRGLRWDGLLSNVFAALSASTYRVHRERSLHRCGKSCSHIYQWPGRSAVLTRCSCLLESLPSRPRSGEWITKHD